MAKLKTAAEAARLVADGATVAVNSSSGLLCPDEVLKALGERFVAEGAPRGLTTIHPIAAGDMFGTKGVDHIAHKGMISRIIGGSYPSGPTNAEPPLIWQRILAEDVAAWNVPSGIVFDMLREGAAKRPGVLTKVGMETFVDPEQDGCAMNASARQSPLVRRVEFDGDTWLHFPAIQPDVAIIRASTADENGNLTFEQEGATLGAMEMALAARNSGGIVIAQVRRVAAQGTLKPHDVRGPGILFDVIVEARVRIATRDDHQSGNLRFLKPFDPVDHGSPMRRTCIRQLSCGIGDHGLERGSAHADQDVRVDFTNVCQPTQRSIPVLFVECRKVGRDLCRLSRGSAFHGGLACQHDDATTHHAGEDLLHGDVLRRSPLRIEKLHQAVDGNTTADQRLAVTLESRPFAERFFGYGSHTNACGEKGWLKSMARWPR